MSILSDFKPFNFNEGVPYASVTPNGVTFNKSVVMKLGHPEHVVLLIDEEGKRIAIQACCESNENAVPFYKPKKNDVISVRWNGKDLLNTLQSMMGWNLNEKAFRVEGTLLKTENAMLFELLKATELK